jgi:nucleotide-binding universal stress UspA family protein
MPDASAPTILAVVAEDGRYAHVRRRAIERARAEGATLLLFDVDAQGSIFDSPLPTAWSGQGQEDQFGDRLTPNDLEAAGRAPLARAVQEARDAGVEAWGWLPRKADADHLADYAIAQGASLIVVSDTERDLTTEIDLPVEVVDANG